MAFNSVESNKTLAVGNLFTCALLFPLQEVGGEGGYLGANSFPLECLNSSCSGTLEETKRCAFCVVFLGQHAHFMLIPF